MLAPSEDPQPQQQLGSAGALATPASAHPSLLPNSSAASIYSFKSAGSGSAGAASASPLSPTAMYDSVASGSAGDADGSAGENGEQKDLAGPGGSFAIYANSMPASAAASPAPTAVHAPTPSRDSISAGREARKSPAPQACITRSAASSTISGHPRRGRARVPRRARPQLLPLLRAMPPAQNATAAGAGAGTGTETSAAGGAALRKSSDPSASNNTHSGASTTPTAASPVAASSSHTGRESRIRAFFHKSRKSASTTHSRGDSNTSATSAVDPSAAAAAAATAAAVASATGSSPSPRSQQQADGGAVVGQMSPGGMSRSTSNAENLDEPQSSPVGLDSNVSAGDRHVVLLLY